MSLTNDDKANERSAGQPVGTGSAIKVNILLAEYGDVTSNIRWLADVRFKLLGLIPLASVAGAWIVSTGNMISPGISLFGLVITVALMIYNERNDQHYNDLIGRARDLERRLGLTDGQFSQRMGPWWVIDLPLKRKLKINHSTAVTWIYRPTIMLWLTGLLLPLVDGLLTLVLKVVDTLLNVLSAPLTADINLGSPPLWSSITVSAIVSILIVLLIFSKVDSDKKTREGEMRAAASLAIEHIRTIPLEPNRFFDTLKYLAVVMGESPKTETILTMISKSRFYMSDENFHLDKPYFQKPDYRRWRQETVYLLSALLSGQASRWFFVTYHRIGKATVDVDLAREPYEKWSAINPEKGEIKDRLQEVTELINQVFRD